MGKKTGNGHPKSTPGGNGHGADKRGAAQPPDAFTEYPPGAAFPGVIGRTVDVSKPAWPEPHRAKPGAPNVLYIVIDDTGFGQLGCYGSPIRTPNIDRLAANGLRYNNMHTTALCSPSRSCILTGRNHHENAMACITEGSTGYPGANGNIPFENGFLSEILREHGYGTFALGKWHLTPADQISAAGPYDRWPAGRGFDRFYGFLGGDTNQYYPDLVYDNHSVEQPKTPAQGYHLTVDLVDKAVQFVADSKQLAPDKPFFMYFCTGAMHAPHQVPQEWADKYKGAFDDGYEKYRAKVHAKQLELGILPKGTQLSRHDPDVPAWDGLSADARRLYARMMEVFAGFLEHTDHQIGRLLDFLKSIGELDNTIVMLISDNGASAEGGPTGSLNENLFFNNVQETVADNLKAIGELGGPKHFNHYMWGWAWAGNTPFRRWKRETYRGGVSDPFIVQWTNGIKARGEIRTQYTHAIDLLPTVLDCLHIEAPEAIRGVTQSPVSGVSFAHTFDQPTAPSRRTTQYFEMFGHRSIYHDGWRAVCPMPGPSFAEAGAPFGTLMSADKLRELDAHGWELYRVADDFAENDNVAAKHIDVVQELVSLWYVAAGQFKVLPIDSSGTMRLAQPRPQLALPRSRYVYYPNTSPVSENVAVRVLNRAHSITADVEIPRGGAEGVILTQGGIAGGFSFFIKGKKLWYVHNYLGQRELSVVSNIEVPMGTVNVRYEFEPTGQPDLAHGKGAPGRAQLYIDRKLVGETQFPITIPLTLGLSGGLCCGRNPGSPVTERYMPPFAFTGGLKLVVVDVSGDVIHDSDAEMRAALAHQ